MREKAEGLHAFTSEETIFDGVGEMDDQQFHQLSRQVLGGFADELLAAVDAEPGLTTRADGFGCTLLHRACEGDTLTWPAACWTEMPISINGMIGVGMR